MAIKMSNNLFKYGFDAGGEDSDSMNSVITTNDSNTYYAYLSASSTVAPADLTSQDLKIIYNNKIDSTSTVVSYPSSFLVLANYDITIGESSDLQLTAVTSGSEGTYYTYNNYIINVSEEDDLTSDLKYSCKLVTLTPKSGSTGNWYKYLYAMGLACLSLSNSIFEGGVPNITGINGTSEMLNTDEILDVSATDLIKFNAIKSNYSYIFADSGSGSNDSSYVLMQFPYSTSISSFGLTLKPIIDSEGKTKYVYSSELTAPTEDIIALFANGLSKDAAVTSGSCFSLGATIITVSVS